MKVNAISKVRKDDERSDRQVVHIVTGCNWRFRGDRECWLRAAGSAA